MPSGKVHDRITVVAAAVSAPAWATAAWASPGISPAAKDWTVGAALVVSLLFSGLLLSPDLDLDSSIYKRWGPFRFIWWPYQKLMPHRSFLSHSIVLGAVLRLVYFLLVTWGLFRIVTYGLMFVVPLDRNALSRATTDAFVTFWRTHPAHLAMTALGLVLGAALHVIADLVVTGVKKRF